MNYNINYLIIFTTFFKIKARKSKEDYGKKLAELMVDPETAGDNDILPDMNFKRAQQAKKYGKVYNLTINPTIHLSI